MLNTSINKLTLVGRVGNDPTLSVTQTGKETLTFSLVTVEKYYVPSKIDATKREISEEKSWHKIRIWGKSAVLGKKMIEMGDMIYVEGSIKYSEWTDGDQNKVSMTEVIVHNFTPLVRSAKNKKKAEDLSFEDSMNKLEELQSTDD